MKKLISIAIAVSVIALTGCATTGLPGFGAEMGKQADPTGMTDGIRIPYTKMVSYYGYVKPGSAPDATIDGKKMYFLYVWVPLAAPEIGIRMVSPSPEGMEPAKGDFVAPLWTSEGKMDKTNYFDTWVSWERALEVINPEDIASKAASATWLKFDANDDSSELPAQPSGSKYNSVLRITSSLDDPLKSVIRGLYRIGFTTYKVGEVQGSFLAQVGAPIDIPGVEIASSLEDLAKVAK